MSGSFGGYGGQRNVMLDFANYGRGEQDAREAQRNVLLMDQSKRDDAFRAAAPGAIAGDPAAMQAAMGANPEKALALAQSISGMDEARRKMALGNMDLLARASGSLLDMDEPAAAAAYPQFLASLRASGLPEASVAALPQSYPGHAKTRQFQQFGLSVQQQIELQGNAAGKAGVSYGSPPSAGAPSGGSPIAAGDVPAEMMPHFQAASARTGIPVATLIAQARQESNFNPNATGKSGEIGVMQIMPSTAAKPGFGMTGVDPATMRDPKANIDFGADYLAARGRAKGVTDWNDPAQRDAGLTAYNGGGDPNYAANVTRYLPTGAAARTGGIDVAGPGAPPAQPAAPQMVDDLTPRDIEQLNRAKADPKVSRAQMEALADQMRKQNQAVARQAAADKLAQDKAARETGRDARPFQGDGMDQQVGNVLIAIGPKVADGTATEAERSQYAIAHGHMSRGSVQMVDDGKGGQVLARIPGVVPPNFPQPDFRPQPTATPTAAPSAGAAQPIAGTAKAPPPGSEGERKAAGYLLRMEDSEKFLDKFVAPIEAGGSGYNSANPRDRVASAVPFVGNFLVTEEGQRYLGAAKEWARAKLRHESGAVIGDAEALEEAKTYFPMPGDRGPVIADKKLRRETAMEALRIAAGRSAKDALAPAATGGVPRATPPPPPGFELVR